MINLFASYGLLANITDTMRGENCTDNNLTKKFQNLTICSVLEHALSEQKALWSNIDVEALPSVGSNSTNFAEGFVKSVSINVVNAETSLCTVFDIF